METQTTKDRILEYIKYKGITQHAFERKCGLSNAYLNNMKKNFGMEKLNEILSIFPDLNRDWLLFGEGEMLNVEEKSVAGSEKNFVNVGNNNRNTVNAGTTIDRMIDELAAQRQLHERQIAKSQEQIDRLLGIVENMQNSK